MLMQQKNDGSKFEDLQRYLRGQVIIENVSQDFYLLANFKTMLKSLPYLFSNHYVELDVLTK